MKTSFQLGALIFSVAALTACATTMSGPAMMSNGVMTGPNGMTLYTFDKDAAGSGKSVCNGQCATLWPPMLAQADAKASGDYSVVTRDDGGKQWAYKGKALYFYKADTKPGDITGDNFRDVWHVIK
jgi:predicted lipoprotein with Yx(FWY)xxD motif